MAARDFVIGTFNVENLDDAKPEEWKKRLEVLRPTLARMAADIILLQEVNSLGALDDLLRGTPYAKYDSVHTKTAKGKPYPKRNLVILSRERIVEHSQYMHDYAKAPVWRYVTSEPAEDQPKEVQWERPILHVKVDVGRDRMLHVINLHLKSMNPSAIEGQSDPKKYWLWRSHAGWAEGFYLSDVKRVGQALEARILVDKIFEADGEDALIAVGGDFNAEIGSVPFKALVGSVEDTQNPDLRSTVLIPCELSVPPDKRFSLIHHGRGNMLDHVAVSQALYPDWIGTDIFNETLHDESLPFSDELKFPESDHAPVVVRFRLSDL